MKRTLTIEEYERLEPELQRLYVRDGEGYTLNENLRDTRLEILAVLAGLLLVRWTGSRYETRTTGGVIPLLPEVLRNRARFVSREFGIELANEWRTVFATGDAGAIIRWMSDTRPRLRYWHETMFRIPFGANPDARAAELLRETLTRHIARHDAFWQGLVGDVANGNLARVSGRIPMHGRAIYTAFETGERVLAILRGMNEERRVLGIAEHCTDCVQFAAVGWQPIGSLPEIGESVCLTNCRCHFEYRRRERARAAAA